MRSGLFLRKASFYSMMPGSLRLPGITFLQSLDDADALLDDGLEVQLLVGKDDVAVASGGKAAVVVIHADALGGGLAGGADSAFPGGLMSNFSFLVYRSSDEDVSVNAIVKDESVWLSQKAMAELFGVSKSTISRHLKNIFDEGELSKEATVANFATVQMEEM